jgi:hypothetical protein
MTSQEDRNVGDSGRRLQLGARTVPTSAFAPVPSLPLQPTLYPDTQRHQRRHRAFPFAAGRGQQPELTIIVAVS